MPSVRRALTGSYKESLEVSNGSTRCLRVAGSKNQKGVGVVDPIRSIRRCECWGSAVALLEEPSRDD